MKPAKTVIKNESDFKRISSVSASKTIRQQEQLNVLGLNEKFNNSANKSFQMKAPESSGKFVMRGSKIKLDD